MGRSPETLAASPAATHREGAVAQQRADGIAQPARTSWIDTGVGYHADDDVTGTRLSRETC